MPAFKAIPVVLILFLIRKGGRGGWGCILVAVMKSHRESQKAPTKESLAHRWYFTEGKSEAQLSEELCKCRNARTNFSPLIKRGK